MITQTEGIQEAIAEMNERFMQAVAQSDAGALSALYTNDAMLLPAGTDFVKGRAAIREFWQGMTSMGIARIRLESLEIERCEQKALEVGSYEITTTAGQEADHGKYLVIWKMEGDQWKIHRDIWTTSLPPTM